MKKIFKLISLVLTFRLVSELFKRKADNIQEGEVAEEAE